MAITPAQRMIPPIKDAASKCCGGVVGAGVVGAAAVEEVEIVVNTCEVVLLGDVELLCSVVVEDVVVEDVVVDAVVEDAVVEDVVVVVVALGGTVGLLLVTVDGFVDVDACVVTDGNDNVFVTLSASKPETEQKKKKLKLYQSL